MRRGRALRLLASHSIVLLLRELAHLRRCPLGLRCTRLGLRRCTCLSLLRSCALSALLFPHELIHLRRFALGLRSSQCIIGPIGSEIIGTLVRTVPSCAAPAFAIHRRGIMHHGPLSGWLRWRLELWHKVGDHVAHDSSLKVASAVDSVQEVGLRRHHRLCNSDRHKRRGEFLLYSEEAAFERPP